MGPELTWRGEDATRYEVKRRRLEMSRGDSIRIGDARKRTDVTRSCEEMLRADMEPPHTIIQTIRRKHS